MPTSTSIRHVVPVVLFASLGLAACDRGYVRPSTLERTRRGPDACQSRCEDLGLEMGAFVLVEDDMAGCVCQPVRPSPRPAPAAPAPVTTPAADPAPAPEASVEPEDGRMSVALMSYAVMQTAAARTYMHQQQRIPPQRRY